MMSEEFYHGWLIQIAHGQEGFLFRCWMYPQGVGVTDHQVYATTGQALYAGRCRADLESLRLSLSNFVNGKLHRLLLSSDERKALEESIDEYVDAAQHRSST